jgi:hypothetical protein
MGLVAAGVLIVLMAIEGRVSPFVTSQSLWVPHYHMVETDFPTPGHLGAVYETVSTLPDSTVLAELPFGADPYDIRSMYFAGYHRKHLLNGFSGFFPASNLRLRKLLENDPPDKPAAFQAMLDAGVTHVIIHERPFPDEKGQMLSDWIRNSGGREIAANGTDRLFAIR